MAGTPQWPGQPQLPVQKKGGDIKGRTTVAKCYFMFSYVIRHIIHSVSYVNFDLRSYPEVPKGGIPAASAADVEIIIITTGAWSSPRNLYSDLLVFLLTLPHLYVYSLVTAHLPCLRQRA